MPLAILFWILMIFWLLFGAWPLVRSQTKNWSALGGWFIPWLAVAVLGWQVFGPMIRA